MTTHLYLDRQSETAYRTYRVYVPTRTEQGDTVDYAGKVIQRHREGRWTAGDADKHANGHTTRAQAVACLLRRVTQPRLTEAAV